MASGNKGREKTLQDEANAARAAAATAAQAVATPDPMEARRREYLTKWDDWRTGKLGPIDVRNAPDQSAIALYNAAKGSQDAGRVGRGYGSLSGDANPNFAAALDKENQLVRDQNAAGMLEGSINNSLSGVDAEMGHWGGVGNQRALTLAELARAASSDAYGRLKDFQNRPPGFLKSLALGALSNVSMSGGGAGGAMKWAI